MAPGRKRLSEAQRTRQSFTKNRISFHRQEFRAAMDERKRAIAMMHNETDPTRKALLSRAAGDLKTLANWHLHKAQKLHKKEGNLFQPKAKSSRLLSLNNFPHLIFLMGGLMGAGINA